ETSNLSKTASSYNMPRLFRFLRSTVTIRLECCRSCRALRHFRVATQQPDETNPSRIFANYEQRFQTGYNRYVWPSLVVFLLSRPRSFPFSRARFRGRAGRDLTGEPVERKAVGGRLARPPTAMVGLGPSFLTACSRSPGSSRSRARPRRPP